MRLSRDYLLGLGSGLVLSALIAILLFHAPPASTKQAAGTAQPGGSGAIGKLDAQNQDGQSQPNALSLNVLASGQPGAPGFGPEAAPAGSAATHGQDQAVQVFVIPQGATAEKIADLLLNQGLLSDRQGFLTLVQEQGAASRLRAGTYQLQPGLTGQELLRRLLD